MLSLLDLVEESKENIYLIIHIEAVNIILSLWYKIDISPVSTSIIRTNNAQRRRTHQRDGFDRPLRMVRSPAERWYMLIGLILTAGKG
jgi:hypothetical protein